MFIEQLLTINASKILPKFWADITREEIACIAAKIDRAIAVTITFMDPFKNNVRTLNAWLANNI